MRCRAAGPPPLFAIAAGRAKQGCRFGAAFFDQLALRAWLAWQVRRHDDRFLMVLVRRPTRRPFPAQDPGSENAKPGIDAKAVGDSGVCRAERQPAASPALVLRKKSAPLPTRGGLPSPVCPR